MMVVRLKHVGCQLAVVDHVDDVTGDDVIGSRQDGGRNGRTQNGGGDSVRRAATVLTV